MRFPFVLTGALAFAMPGQWARAQDLGDPDKGFEFAKDACTECHAVKRGEDISPLPNAPSFQQLADTPGMTAMALSAALLTSHETMPNFILSTEERDNVIAYVLSLKE